MKELWKVGDVNHWIITFSATYNIATLKTCLEKIMVLFCEDPGPGECISYNAEF